MGKWFLELAGAFFVKREWFFKNQTTVILIVWSGSNSPVSTLTNPSATDSKNAIFGEFGMWMSRDKFFIFRIPQKNFAYSCPEIYMGRIYGYSGVKGGSRVTMGGV